MNLIQHGKTNEYLFREKSMLNFINYWYHLSHESKVIYNNKEVLYNYIPLRKIKKLAYTDYYDEDILKELEVDYKIINLLSNSTNYIIVNIKDLDKLTWMRNKYHPLSLKEFIETYKIDYTRIKGYCDILNIKLVTPYNKKDYYFNTQDDWNKLAEIASKSRKERVEFVCRQTKHKSWVECIKEQNNFHNSYIKENKIFTSRSAGKYLGIEYNIFKKYAEELNIKPIGKIKKIYDIYSIEQVELIKHAKNLDLDFSKYMNITQLSKELNYYRGQCINALESYNIQPILVQDVNYYPKEEAIKCITEYKNNAKSHRTSSLENNIKNILAQNSIEFLENQKPIKSPKTNRPLELDIIIPNKNVAIEFDGIYYHSEGMLMRAYNYIDEKVKNLWTHNYYKTELGEQINLQVLHIRDVDWIRNHKTNQIKGLINRFTLSPNTILFNYDIKEINHNSALKFHQENSIFYNDDFNSSFAVFQDNEIIQLVSLKNNEIINYSINNNKILDKNDEKIIFDFLKKKYKKLYAEFIRDIYPTKYVQNLGFKIIKSELPTYEYAFKNKFWNKDYVENGDGLNFFYEKGWIEKYDSENLAEFLWNNKIAKYWNCGYLLCEL